MKKEHITDGSPANSDMSDSGRVPATSTLQRWFSMAAEPRIMYPALAIFVLATIWGTTLSLISSQRTAAEHTSAVLTHQLAVTYEAQIVRALREIDQTLKIVKYASGVWNAKEVLQKLQARDLLLPSILFDISVTNNNGDIVSSTNSKTTAATNVASWDVFQSQRQADVFSISRPRRDQASGTWRLDFSRRLNTPDDHFAGIVILSVDAAYFVSSYESAQFGQHGVLGLIGSDDVFRARRIGDKVSAGGHMDIASVMMKPGSEGEMTSGAVISDARILTGPWDGVRRYMMAHELRGYPVSVLVGLSVDEQMAGVRQARQTYLWLAFSASLLALLVIVVLSRMSRQLALSRQLAVEEHIANAERAEYLAFHDSLTTLPNRSMFSKLLGHSISRASRYNHKLAVLFLDLDHFKDINDTLGHEAGDQLLQEVATRLQACLRDSDTVARLGGDEFIVLLPELDVEQYAATVAQKILSAVAQPFILQGQEVRVTASVGISTYPQDGMDEQTLTKNADTAMYYAKDAGKNNFQFYSEKLNASSLERLNLESGLRLALEKNEFQLYYHAKLDVSSGRVTGMEALLRWHHPDLGMVAPMQFIPITEETGLIIPIGEWVLRSACLQNVAWQNQGLPHLNMAVNLTARQFFDEQLLSKLELILAETGMDAHLLELEISESLLMHETEKTLRVMRGVKDMGIQIVIDDFGAGYSSFAALKQFPLDTIKIHRSFIRDANSVAEDKALTQAIIAMGRTLSLNVVAQGVETREQAEYLRQSACDEFQGFYLNKPVPADQVVRILQTEPNMRE